MGDRDRPPATSRPPLPAQDAASGRFLRARAVSGIASFPASVGISSVQTPRCHSSGSPWGPGLFEALIRKATCTCTSAPMRNSRKGTLHLDFCSRHGVLCSGVKVTLVSKSVPWEYRRGQGRLVVVGGSRGRTPLRPRPRGRRSHTPPSSLVLLVRPPRVREMLDKPVCIWVGFGEWMSVFQGGGREQNLQELFETAEEPVSVVARTRQWPASAGLGTTLCISQKRQEDPVYRPQLCVAQGTSTRCRPLPSLFLLLIHACRRSLSLPSASVLPSGPPPHSPLTPFVLLLR